MAVFGMSSDPEGHEQRAVNAGLAILRHITNADYGGNVKLKIGVGVNTGEAMIGYVGTQQRIELTALGYNVNVAHALQTMARPNRLLIGPETALGVAGILPLHDLGKTELKGRREPLQIYEVLQMDVPFEDDMISL